MATTSLAPINVPLSQSLYIQNLPDKLQKDDLKRALYMLFSTYGPVLDVTALKTPKMRGQAHVLFRDTQSATQAIRSCQGSEMFGREMVRLPLYLRATFRCLRSLMALLFDDVEDPVLEIQIKYTCETDGNGQST